MFGRKNIPVNGSWAVTGMGNNNTEREFWLLVYRHLSAIAAAVKRYKLTESKRD